MKTKHTPGPWEANGEAVDAENSSVYNIAMCNYAYVPMTWSGANYSTQSHQLANARLIAAAPDLLAALKAVVEFYSYAELGPIADAREAISKATGEPA